MSQRWTRNVEKCSKCGVKWSKWDTDDRINHAREHADSYDEKPGMFQTTGDAVFFFGGVVLVAAVLGTVAAWIMYGSSR